MSTLHLLDPSFHPMLEAFPEFEMTADILPGIREQGDAFARDRMCDPDAAGIIREEISFAGLNAGDPPVRCLLYAPKGLTAPVGGVLHIHGGG